MNLQRCHIDRRLFCTGLAAALAQAATPRVLTAATATPGYALVASVDRTRILQAAGQYLHLAPQTITSFPSDRNPGGLHDFFSEADYFWPNPTNPNGPYINIDGKSNPTNFQGHRKAMIALSVRMPALSAAWRFTGKRTYGEHAAAHLRAWFVDASTRMNPNLEFSQGVRNSTTGRSYGIIDTLHLVEVAAFPVSRRIFQRDGNFFKSGDRFTQPELAATLRRIAADPKTFYTGAMPAELAASVQQGGGLLTDRKSVV